MVGKGGWASKTHVTCLDKGGNGQGCPADLKSHFCPWELRSPDVTTERNHVGT